MGDLRFLWHQRLRRASRARIDAVREQVASRYAQEADVREPRDQQATS